MNNNWIMIDKSLGPLHPKIIRVADLTGLDPYAVVGRMVYFWSYVDTHVRDDGRLSIRDLRSIADKFALDPTQNRAKKEAFWRAIADESVGWLGVDENGLFIPDFNLWFSKSAKRRALNTQRQAELRAADKLASVTSEAGHAVEGDSIYVAPALRQTARRNARPDVERDVDVELDEDLRASTSNVALDPSGGRAPDADAGVVAQFFSSHDWEEARRLARIAAPIVRPANERDRELLLKVAALAKRFGENWFHDSVRAVELAYQRPKPPAKKRPGYFYGVLRSRCKDLGEDFNAQLARIRVPLDLVAMPQASAAHPP